MKNFSLLSFIFLTVTFFCPGQAHASDPDFTKGVFIVNEDWYGHQNSTVNYFDHNSPDGDVWKYRVVQEANPWMQLGCTNQFGAIYGGRFYLIAKQDKDPGASVQGGRITVCDASDMKILYQSPLIDPSGKTCDGRACMGVDENKIYISSSNGIWVFDTDSYTVTGQVKGSANPNGEDGKPVTDPSGSLYHGQCGSMVRVNDRVFAAHQSYGLLVIDPATDEVVETFDMEKITEQVIAETGIKTRLCGIGSVVLACDGSIWASLAKTIQGDGATVPFLLHVDPATLNYELVRIPDNIYPPANSWYAWTPDGFSSSAKKNVLYWNGGPNSWFANSKIYRFDIDTREFRCIIDLDKEAEEQGLDKYTRWQLYGCSMREHPVTGYIYMSLMHYFQDPTYCLRRSDDNGKTLGEYDMIQNYWFPSIPVFPDNDPPVTTDLGIVNAAKSRSTLISLDGWATDADNMDAAIVKTVESVSDPSQFSAVIVNGNLLVTPVDEASGRASVTIKVNSNGKVIESVVQLDFNNTGIGQTESRTMNITVAGDIVSVDSTEINLLMLYSADGRRIAVSDDRTVSAGSYKGIAILRIQTPDGNIITRKITI